MAITKASDEDRGPSGGKVVLVLVGICAPLGVIAWLILQAMK